jgi:hypothetical protein
MAPASEEFMEIYDSWIALSKTNHRPRSVLVLTETKWCAHRVVRSSITATGEASQLVVTFETI